MTIVAATTPQMDAGDGGHENLVVLGADAGEVGPAGRREAEQPGQRDADERAEQRRRRTDGDPVCEVEHRDHDGRRADDRDRQR